MSSHIAKCGQQKFIELFVCHAVVLDGFAVSRFIRHIVGRIGHDQVGFQTIHQKIDMIGIGAVTADHPVPAQCPDIAGLNKRLHSFRIDIAVIILDVLVMDLGEKIIDLSGIKAGSAHIVAGQLKILQKICQRLGFPFADSLVQRDIERLFILRVLDMDNSAVNFRPTQSISVTPSALSTL